jgi:hypothetical protein
MRGQPIQSGPRCECCAESDDLLVCGDLDEPTLYFCPRHYIEHVRYAHDSKPLPGCSTIEAALNLFSSAD